MSLFNHASGLQLMMKIKDYKMVIGVAVILLILTWMGFKPYYGQSGTIHLAFVGPLSGEGGAAGKSMTQAIQWYLDTINQQGGIHGNKIVLDLFDDENDTKLAKQKALEIVEQDRALAVIGHWYSSASIEGGKIYKQHKIPAITPGSTNIQVTLNNEWYFRNIFNANSSGQFLANYVNKVLKQHAVTIIHEEAAYGAYLAQVFEQTSYELGTEIKYKWSYNNEEPKIDQIFQNIVEELQTKQSDVGIIFLAVQAIEGVKLVKLIKDAGIPNPIIGSTSFSEKTFLRGFETFPKEKNTPGYYTDGIYVATPLIFDTANEVALQFKAAYQARYQEESDWAAAYAFDTVLVLIEAIKQGGIQGQSTTRIKDRQKIRDYLANLNQLDKAIEGVTGFNYFDHHGDALKPVSIGVYRNNNIISALTQLQVIRNVEEIYDLDAALHEERVLLIDDKYMYQTKVVYTGININEISELDLTNLTYTLDFYLWFRFQGEINPQQIEFLNAVEPIRLDSPQIDETIDQMNYRLYRVKGQFKADFLPSHHTFKQHVLGLNFHHRDLTRNNLIYVIDVLGMGLTNGQSLLRKMQQVLLLSADIDWNIQQIWFFQDIITETSLGNPKYIDIPGGTIDYSQFNAAILIKPDEFNLVALFPNQLMAIMAPISLILLILLQMANKHDQVKKFSKSILVFQAILALLLLLSGEVVLFDWLLTQNNSFASLEFIITFFDILWWVIPAILLTLAAERFIWTPLETRTERRVPHIMRNLLSFMIYTLSFFGIIAFVFEHQMTSLLATSGLIAMIVGLAIQVNISNIFSGIAINLDRPFRVGDWVKIGEFEEGKVVNITWRTTQFVTRKNCWLNIPNSTTSESIIHNFNSPNDITEEWIIVHLDSNYSPAFIENLLLDAARSAEGVLTDPEPFTRLRNIGKWAAEYTIGYYIKEYAKKNLIRRAVWNSVWNHLNHFGIVPAIQRHKFYLHQQDKKVNSWIMGKK